MIKKIEVKAGLGLTAAQIASTLGVSRDVLFKNKARNQEIQDAIKNGKARAIEDVSNALFQNAMSGDNTAAIFFLKNRDREAWGERKAVAPKTTFEFDASLPANKQAEQIIQAAASGKLPSDIAQNYINMIASTVKIDEITEMAEKLKDIEKLLGVENG